MINLLCQFYVWLGNIRPRLRERPRARTLIPSADRYRSILKQFGSKP